MIRRALALAVVLLLLPAVAFAGVPKQQVVAGARLAAIADKLAHQLVNDPDRSVAPAFPIADQNVPQGDVVLAAGVPQVNPTYVAIPVSIAVDGKAARTVYAGYRVISYVRTAVAARDLAPGEVLAGADITTARVPSMGRPAVDAVALVGRRIRSATSRGMLVFAEQTSTVELVKAGAGAILIVHDGTVSLTADVVARTGGGLGDTVTVWNVQTQKALAGVVTGPNQVELVLPEASQ